MTTVYLERHAQPVYQGYQETPELVPLSEKGRADSERLGGVLQGRGEEQIYSRPYPGGGQERGGGEPGRGAGWQNMAARRDYGGNPRAVWMQKAPAKGLQINN